MLVVLSLKRDVESKDDQDLALLELGSLAEVQPELLTHSEGQKVLRVSHLPFIHIGQLIYSVDISPTTLNRLLRRLAFWECALFNDYGLNIQEIAVGRAWSVSSGLAVAATQSRILEWTAYAKDDENLGEAICNGHALEGLLALGAPGVEAAIAAPLTPTARRKNEYLTHGFHKYKAKFFPRLARALINYTCPDDNGLVLDPYCGSGTTGVECLLMGMDAIETDIDPLSVFIAQSKTILGNFKLSKFVNAVSKLPVKAPQLTEDLFTTSLYQIPAFILERNPKRLTDELHQEIKYQATLIQEFINECSDDEVRNLFSLAFSHALSTKINLRWMGTGDNRFALEFSKRSLYRIFQTQLRYMLSKLNSWNKLRTGGFLPHHGTITAEVSDCSKLPIEANSVDAVVTSPPYLPAASGRETYLRSRAASLVGLGLMNEADIHETESRVVGSILAAPEGEKPIPKAVSDLVDWMQPQRERAPKAQPTIAYFERLGSSLREMKRVLKPGGMIALVISKEHMFYEMRTRRVLRMFNMADVVVELGCDERYGVGLELDRVQLLELPKMDFNARPGSRGTYSEAIIFFRKPVSA